MTNSDYWVGLQEAAQSLHPAVLPEEIVPGLIIAIVTFLLFFKKQISFVIIRFTVVGGCICDL